ncbi:MAG: hypothetical protein EU530_08610 [Promethearchaeota archaeon]|nr:MAG: hypothetical protein EU530_08610 [Candidatus Lokiarchaeota archaeon]
MAKKRKSNKPNQTESDELQPAEEKSSSQPRTEIQNLISALETKDVPMLKSSLPQWTADGEDENIVDTPSFLTVDPTPTTESKLIPVSKPLVHKIENKQYSSTGELYGDIGVFITELTDSYAQRYDSWEESTNSVLAVLRKLQMITLDNTQQLVSTIEVLQEQINDGLNRFRVKRDYVETYSETNHAEVALMLKKTLDLLALQIKEFKIKERLNQLISIYTK